MKKIVLFFVALILTGELGLLYSVFGPPMLGIVNMPQAGPDGDSHIAEAGGEPFVSFTHKTDAGELFIISNRKAEKNTRFRNTDLTKNVRYDKLTDQDGNVIYQSDGKDRILCCWDNSFVVLNYKKWQLEIYDYALQLQNTVPLNVKKYWSVLNCELRSDTLYVFDDDHAEPAAVVKLK